MQHDMDMANNPGSVFRADINSMAGALVTNNAGASAPSPTFAHMWWPDTTNGILKQRNAANTAWIDRIYNDENKFPGDVTFAGDIKFTPATSYITMDTSGGSDIKSLRIGGGGAIDNTRGSSVKMHGNEHAASPGVLSLEAGDVTGGKVILRTGGATRLTVLESGKVGINVIPTAQLHVAAVETPVAAFDSTSTDGTIIAILQAGTQEGTISVSGTTVSYNAFCGSHYIQLKKGQKELPVGAVVVSTGKIIKCNNKQKERFVYIDTTNIAGDKRASSVWFGKLSDDAKRMSFGEDEKPVYLRAQVGLFVIRVTDTNGNIKNGDYIESSMRRNEGQKQTGNVKKNSSIAKAEVDVNWTKEKVDEKLGYKWKLIPCLF